MKKKLFLSIALGIVLIAILMKYYTNYVYNSAIKDYEKKYVNDFNNLNLEKSKNKFKSIPNYKERLIDKFDNSLYDSILRVSSYNNALVFSLIISNKWNNSEASFNVFTTLAQLDKRNSSTNLPDIDFLDKETKEMALHYLQKASDSDNPNAKYILGKYYIEGKFLKRNVTLGNTLLREAKDLSGGILE